MTHRTPLEQYLSVGMQMLMARLDGRNEDPYLDKLDVLHGLLTSEDVEFLDKMGKDWATHYWCLTCSAAHLNSFKCTK